jgi:transposase-like protein
MPYGKNFGTLRKWATEWELDMSHLAPYVPRASTPRFTEEQVRSAVAASRSWAESLRRLGYCPTGGNPRTLKKWVERWGISTAHFDPYAASSSALEQGRRREATPLDEILVENSTYSRSKVKERLYRAGLKERRCELCGQDEIWRGKRISMILDHINGVRDDNRLENLQIVCPNCAASLETHCGKNLPRREPRSCDACKTEFLPNRRDQRYCSRECGLKKKWTQEKRQEARRVERPPYEQLLAEIKRLGFLAVGRKYGVSDNAIRKWVRQYERELAVAEGRDPEAVEIPRRTWPNRKRDGEH